MFNLPIELPLLYLIILAVISFLLLFFIIFWLSFILFEKVSNKIRKDADITREISYKEAVRILEDSRKKAFGIVEDANMRAKKVLDDANVFSADAKKLLEGELQGVCDQQRKSLENTAQELLGLYRKVVTEEKEGGVEAIRSLSEGLKRGVEEEVKEFKEALHEETVGSQEAARQRVNEEYQELEKELNNYKETQYKKIDDSIYKILVAASKGILGEVLNLEDHQQLVMRILEEAKEEGSIENV